MADRVQLSRRWTKATEQVDRLTYANAALREQNAVLVAERDALAATCERLLRAVRAGGELERVLLDAPEDGDRIGNRLLAFSAAYVACEEHGDLGPPEGEV